MVSYFIKPPVVMGKRIYYRYPVTENGKDGKEHWFFPTIKNYAKLYDISFKLDNQTMAGKYGSDFTASLKLSQLLDLNTGKWKF